MSRLIGRIKRFPQLLYYHFVVPRDERRWIDLDHPDNLIACWAHRGALKRPVLIFSTASSLKCSSRYFQENDACEIETVP